MIAQVPEVKTVHGKLGRAETATDPAPLTMIETTVQLKPRADWRPGVLNSLSGHMANVSHGPIPDIGWPAMTMDMTLLDGAEIGAIEPGDEVMMMLEKGPDGMFAIRALMPKE